MNELLTQPPVQIGAWLACLAFTVMLANGLLKLWSAIRGKPAPGELSERLTKVEVTQTDHSRRLKALEKNDTDIRCMIVDNDKNLRDMIEANDKNLRDLFLAENAKIYDRVNKIAEDLYSLRGKIDTLLSRLTKGGAS